MTFSVGLSRSSRTRPLADGRVTIEGHDPQISFLGVQDLFNQQMSHHTFDVCEFPIVTYLRQLGESDPQYLAIPVFPSRHFRLGCVFVSQSSAIERPAELAGRKIGVPTFDMAAAVWLRGIFADHHGLDRFSPTYVIAGMEAPRDGDEHPQLYPDGFTFEFRSDASLVDMLANGEIDAVVTARAPSSWPDGGARRLFSDSVAAERQYFADTGIFPAMHVLAMKRDLAQKYPDLPGALFTAFTQAQEVGHRELFDSAALDTLLPWQVDHLLETEQILGKNYWPVGVSANKRMLDTIIDYSFADGLIETRFAAHDLFVGPGSADLTTT